MAAAVAASEGSCKVPARPARRPVDVGGLKVVQDRLQRNAQQSRQDQANAARYAVSEHDVRTVGIGNVAPPGVIFFTMPFVDEPQFSYGSALIPGPGLTNWHYPYANAMVLSWTRDPKGAYIGVRMSYRVGIDSKLEVPPSTYPLVEVKHMLSFTAIGYKPVIIPTGEVKPIRINF